MRKIIRIMFVIITFMGLLMVLSGCSTLRPLSTGKTLDGYPVKNLRVIVSDSYSFTPGLVTHTLPTGIYNPVMEDDDGIYFQSPSKLFLGGLLGSTLHDGGLFFKGGVSTDVYEYIIIENENSNWKLPNDFKFRIEKKP